MRKFLVESFAFYHLTRGRNGKIYFASRKTLPLLFAALLIVSGVLLDSDYPIFNFFDYMYTTIACLLIFFSLIYFRFKPAKWKDLDNEQKYYIGEKKIYVLSGEEQDEYELIKESYENGNFCLPKRFFYRQIELLMILMIICSYILEKIIEVHYTIQI